jgi:hypothetical protein
MSLTKLSLARNILIIPVSLARNILIIPGQREFV